MNRRTLLGSALLITSVLAAAGALAAWKQASLDGAAAASANQPEPLESITAVAARARDYRPSTTAIGTVLALRSITLRNELPGTVHTVAMTPGQIVDAGAMLVQLDVSVEQAELAALQAEARLAASSLARVERLRDANAVSQEEADRARADRDVANARIARTRAVIERKTIRAPFRARVGIFDVHEGQYLNEGTLLTTLQGVDDAVHVDFAVEQQVAAALAAGDPVSVDAGGPPLSASVVAIDARIDPATRNAMVRARLEDSAEVPAPGSSVRVRVAAGRPTSAIGIPASALRKGPQGDHVFVVATDADGHARAHMRGVKVLAALGDEVVIAEGLEAGEQIAASGSFKLRENVRVALADSQFAGTIGGGH